MRFAGPLVHSGRERPRRAASLSAVILTAVLASAVLSAAPAPAAESYPSWEDIRAAQSSASAKAAEADRVEGFLTELREEAGSLGDAAVSATNRYNAAVEELAANEQLLISLATQREAAAGHASDLMRQVAALAAQTYKTGGAAADSAALMLLDADGSVDALHGADLMDRVSSLAGNLYADALASEKVAAGFSEQEQQARDARAKLVAEAERYVEEADSSAAAAAAAIREEETRKSVLLAQLAELRDSTVEAEEARIRGIAAEKAFRDQEAAAERSAQESPRPGAGQAAGGEASPETAPPPVTSPSIPAPVKPAPVAPAPVAPAPVAPAPVAPSPAPVAPAPAPPAPVAPVNDPAGAQNYAAGRMASFGWDGNEFRCLVNLWNRESNWRTNAANPYSGAYGIPQSLPGSKMATHGADWQTNYRTQINWGLDYIKYRYGSPCAAWAHSEEVNWY
ncbi:coiled-coil domain-containing protein [Arthrobacter zhangbolii]|uniref:coiled-coil domain-containing protein n=1 Tax=Arthrobacter zhangbolii TaxID=2886936 RepID=UPI001D150367|nr:lytic transglycosylase domain-containing protein [Arthrobacter zhangbolii]